MMRDGLVAFLVLALILGMAQHALAGEVVLPVRTLGERQTWRIDPIGEGFPGGWPEYYINYKIATSFWTDGEQAAPFEMVVIVPYTNELRWIEARAAQSERNEWNLFAFQMYSEHNTYPEYLAFQVTVYGPLGVVAEDLLRFHYTDSAGSQADLQPARYEPVYESDPATPAGAQLQLLAPLPPHPETLEWFGLMVRSLAGGEPIQAKWRFRAIPEENTILFADPALERVIRHKVELPHGPLEQDDVLWIRELSATSYGIRSLAGIEHLEQLEVLRLTENAITDVTSLAGLRKLRVLDLSMNQIDDVAPLATLNELVELDLANNRVQSLDGLEALPNLGTLNISGNPVRSLAPLQRLESLRRLVADGIGLRDLSEVGQIRQVVELSLSSNEIENLKPLAALTNLESLSLAGNRIRDLEPLATLSALRYLDIRGNAVENLLPLERLTSLERLDASHNQIQHIDVLRDLPRLREADVSLNRIEFIGSWVEQRVPRLWAMGNPLRESWLSEETLERLRGSLESEKQAGQYTLRFYKHAADPWRSTVELWHYDELVGAAIGFHFALASEWMEELAPGAMTDFTGDGRDDLVLVEFTGGWHCCTMVHLFELEPELKYVTSVYGGHETPYFTDLDGDGRTEALVKDWTFAYWKTAFATSPAPRVILRFDGNQFVLAPEFMRAEPPTEDALERLAREVRAAQDWEYYVRMEGVDPAPPAKLWAVMLDLIYTGNWQLAFAFLEAAWPEDVPGKDAFLQAFLDRLQRSMYWDELIQMFDESELHGTPGFASS